MRGTEQRGWCYDPSGMNWLIGLHSNLTCRDMDLKWAKSLKSNQGSKQMGNSTQIPVHRAN